MAKRCDICGKGTTTGNNISHADNKSKRTWGANIQRIRVMDDGRPVRKSVCTACIKSGKITRAI